MNNDIYYYLYKNNNLLKGYMSYLLLHFLVTYFFKKIDSIISFNLYLYLYF